MLGMDIKKGFLQVLDELAETRLTEEQAAEIYRQRIRAGIMTYVVEEHGEIVASASLHLEKKYIHGGAIAGRIEDVVVKKSHRKQTIGEQLIKHITDEAFALRKCYKVTLDCYEHLVHFYEKNGYKKHDVGMRINVIEWRKPILKS